MTLEDLLDRTRDVLLSGRLGDLADLAPKVEALAAALPRMDLATADRLRNKAARNARLLQAAQSGVRAARQRLGAIAAGASLATYDAQGARKVIPALSERQIRRV